MIKSPTLSVLDQITSRELPTNSLENHLYTPKRPHCTVDIHQNVRLLDILDDRHPNKQDHQPPRNLQIRITRLANFR